MQTLGEFTVRAKRKHQESIDLASQVWFIFIFPWTILTIICRDLSVGSLHPKLQELRIR